MYSINYDKQMGYGKWEDVRQEIQKCQEFQFDWFFRTRSAPELQRRCDVLIRAIEKEAENSLRGRGRASEKRDSDEDDAEMKKEEKKNTRKRRKKMTKTDVKTEDKNVECSCLFQFLPFSHDYSHVRIGSTNKLVHLIAVVFFHQNTNSKKTIVNGRKDDEEEEY